jgi:hypothetical protein
VVFPTGRPFEFGSEKWQLRPPDSGKELDEDEEAALSDGEGEGRGPVLRVGPGGIEDPETMWDYGDSAEPLPALETGEYLLLLPGEDVLVVDSLPRPRRSDVAFVLGAGELALSDGKHRYWVRTPGGTSNDHPDAPVVSRLVVVFVAHRAVRRTNRPRRYVAALDVDDNLLGWLDYSDTWPLRTDRLEQMAVLTGVHFETERYLTEAEFESAHPDWVG